MGYKIKVVPGNRMQDSNTALDTPSALEQSAAVNPSTIVRCTAARVSGPPARTAHLRHTA
jgi:hypothetical protein